MSDFGSGNVVILCSMCHMHCSQWSNNFKKTYNPTVPNRIHATDVQRKRIQEILKAEEKSPPKPAVVRARTIAMLIDGKTPSEIARLLGKTPQRISQIKNEVFKIGLDAATLALLADLTRLLEDKCKNLTKRKTAGRPGRETWEDYLESDHFTGEDYVQIATLFVSARLQVAVIVTGRVPREEKRDHSSTNDGEPARLFFNKRIHSLITDVAAQKEFERPPWTRISNFDVECYGLFDKWAQKLAKLPPLDSIEGRVKELLHSPNYKRFNATRRAMVIWSGDESEAEKFFKEAFESADAFLSYRIAETRNFFPALANLIFECRNSVTGVGTLPCLKLMSDDFGELAELEINEGIGEAIWWEAPVSEINKSARITCALRDFLALKGVLMGHNAMLARRIPYHASVKFATSSIATRVKVVKESKGKGINTLLVFPLPECGYEINYTSTRNPEQVAKSLRRCLRRSIRFVYEPSVEALSDEMPGQNQQLEEFLSRCVARAAPRHLTLLPRHLLRKNCTALLAGLDWKPNTLTKIELPCQDGKEAGAILDVSMVREALWNAFRQNHIGDHVLRLAEWSYTLIGRSMQYREQDASSWAREAGVFPLLIPCFWWLPPNDADESKDPKMLERLAHFTTISKPNEMMQSDTDGLSLLPEGSEIVGVVWSSMEARKMVESIAAEVVESLANLRLDPELSAELDAIAIKHPPHEFKRSIDNYRAFSDVICELDADYLISHLPASVRVDLDKIVAEWTDHSAAVLAQKFWNGGRLNEPLLRAALPANVRPRVSPQEINDVATDALKQFSLGRGRVLRWVIETAQRQILAGQSPVFAVAEADSDVIRSWCSYFRQYSLRQLNFDPNQTPIDQNELSVLNPEYDETDCCADSPDLWQD